MRWSNEPTKDGSIAAADAKAPTEIVDDANTATSNGPSDAVDWRNMSAADLEARMLADIHTQLSELDPEVVQDAIRKGKRGIPFARDFELETDEDFEIEEDDKRAASKGFWAEGEPEMGPDEDYYADDITSHGHGELRKHRDLREYARLIAWELPLLSRMSLAIAHLCGEDYRRKMLIPDYQNLPAPSSPQQQQHPSGSGTRPTWANHTQPATK